MYFRAVISIYMLIDGDKLWKGVLRLIPEAHRDRIVVIFRQSILGFIRGQLLFIGQRVAGLLGVFLSIPIAGIIAIWIHLEHQQQEPLGFAPDSGDKGLNEYIQVDCIKPLVCPPNSMVSLLRTLAQNRWRAVRVRQKGQGATRSTDQKG